MKKIIILSTLVAMLGSSCVENEATRLAKAEQHQRDSIALVQKHIADSIAFDQKLAWREAFNQQYPIDSVSYDPTIFVVEKQDTGLMVLYSLFTKYARHEEIELCHEFPLVGSLNRDPNILSDIALALIISLVEDVYEGPYQVPHSSALFDYDPNEPEEMKLLRIKDRHLPLETKTWLQKIGANSINVGKSEKKLTDNEIEKIVLLLTLRKHLREKK